MHITKTIPIALLLCGFVASAISAYDELAGSDYEPLTEIEAQSWINHVDVQEVVDLVIAYDFVEHANPVVMFPTHDVVVTDDEITLTPRGAIVIRIGRFWWGVTPPVETATFDPAGFLPGYLWGAVGLGIGALATFLLCAIFSK